MRRRLNGAALLFAMAAMLIVFTIRSGCGRARSIDSSPFFKSALRTSIPSANTKQR